MRFRIDLKLFLIVFIFIFTKQIHIYILMMGFALLHELGHLFAGIFLKMKPEKIEIIPVGLTISFKVSIKDINKKIGNSNMLELKKIFVALAGPTMNLIIILITKNMQIEIIKQIEIIYANTCIFIFNMLPIYPLDGGRIIKGILEIKQGRKMANYHINKTSIIITSLLTILSIIVLYYNFNMSIILIITYIWILVIKENKVARHKQKIYEIIEKTIEKKIKK